MSLHCTASNGLPLIPMLSDRWPRTTLFLPLLALCACSAGVDVQTIVYPEASRVPVMPAPAEIRIFRSTEPLPATCCPIGDVFVGDDGGSIDCRYDRVVGEVKDVAWRLQANAAVIRRVPDRGSDCFQVRARLLRCPVDVVPGRP